MNDKLHDEAEEIRTETAADAPELQEHDRVAELERQLEEANSKALYAAAEVQNVRRRLEQEKVQERTYAATPDPKWVVAVGDCAFDGGLFGGSYAVVGGVSKVVPVDLHIPGCPPSPMALLKGLLALLQSTQ